MTDAIGGSVSKGLPASASPARRHAGHGIGGSDSFAGKTLGVASTDRSAARNRTERGVALTVRADDRARMGPVKTVGRAARPTCELGHGMLD